MLARVRSSPQLDVTPASDGSVQLATANTSVPSFALATATLTMHVRDALATRD